MLNTLRSLLLLNKTIAGWLNFFYQDPHSIIKADTHKCTKEYLGLTLCHVASCLGHDNTTTEVLAHAKLLHCLLYLFHPFFRPTSLRDSRLTSVEGELKLTPSR